MSDRDIVDENTAIVRIMKPWHQADEGRFTAAGFADECDGLSLFDFKVDVFENPLVVWFH